jgi:RNA polymerase sigma-70 factor (ECF subfamily)
VIDAAAFERERPWLVGLAYRLLGSVADAEDVVQEAFLRAREVEDVRTPRALLTTVVTRLCLDEVRSARRRREDYVGPWLPEPVATDAPATDARAEVQESLSMAFLLLLESLSPLERAVFVLCEVFDLEMSEVAAATGRSEAACRQLLHRAREHLAAGRRRRRVEPEALQTAAGAMLMAIASGDLDGLTRLLLDDAKVTSDHGGKARAALREVVGADPAARMLIGLMRKFARTAGHVRVAWINGAVGVVAIEDGVVASVMVPDLVVADGVARVASVYVVRNPDKLARLTTALRAGSLREVIPS